MQSPLPYCGGPDNRVFMKFGYVIICVKDVARALAAGAVEIPPPASKAWGQTASFLRDCGGIVVEPCSPATEA
jgi:hypothetical protein